MIMGLLPRLEPVSITLLLRVAQVVHTVRLRTFTLPGLSRVHSTSVHHVLRRPLLHVACDHHLLLATSSLSLECQMMMAENQARAHFRLITRPASLPLIIHHPSRFPLPRSSSGQSLPPNMKCRPLQIQAALDRSVLAWRLCIPCNAVTPTNETLWTIEPFGC